AAALCRGEPLAVADACEIVRQAALGLHHAHQQGMVHRDVKPSNLFVTRQGVVKVIDLGLARTTDRQLGVGEVSSVRTLLGTPECMAPEQWGHSAVDLRADVYSLGCTLYALLTAHNVFPVDRAADRWVASMDSHRFEKPPSLLERRPDAPARVAE